MIGCAGSDGYGQSPTAVRSDVISAAGYRRVSAQSAACIRIESTAGAGNGAESVGGKGARNRETNASVVLPVKAKGIRARELGIRERSRILQAYLANGHTRSHARGVVKFLNPAFVGNSWRAGDGTQSETECSCRPSRIDQCHATAIIGADRIGTS